ncbi:MAG: DNA repair protein RecO [Thermomicrobiales bacterium]
MTQISGTSGNTHGDEMESTPATNAAMIVTSGPCCIPELPRLTARVAPIPCQAVSRRYHFPLSQRGESPALHDRRSRAKLPRQKPSCWGVATLARRTGSSASSLQEAGKLSVIAKGSRKPTARSGPAVQYFARSRFMLARGRDLDVVTSAELLDRPVNLESNLTRLAHASHMAELTSKLVQEERSIPPSTICCLSLKHLGEGDDDLPLVRWFEVNLLTAVGYQLDFWTCASCHRELGPERNFLGMHSGGMLCPECRSADGNAFPVSINAQKYLRFLHKEGIRAASSIRITPDVASEVERVMAAYISSVLERDLTSLRVLREIRERSGGYSV